MCETNGTAKGIEVLAANTTSVEYIIARRAVVLAQVAAYEQLVRTLKEEAALLSKQANLTKPRNTVTLNS